MEQSNEIQRSEVWEQIYKIVKTIPRADCDGMDAPDAPSVATELEKLFLKLLTIPAVSGRSLMSEFWKESADLIEKYRDSGDERAAQGVVSCRILIDRLMKQLENDR